MPGYMYLIYLAAFGRLVVLLTMDVITEGPRDRLVTELKKQGRNRLAYLMLCPWCLSIWLALPAALLIYAYGTSPWLFVPALWFALSMAAGAAARVKG